MILALLAETNRAPFDLTEAEQELTQGYMTEYSGMKFALFMMAEYLGMIAVSLVAIAVFFGGYHLWPMDGLPILAPVIFILKVVLDALLHDLDPGDAAAHPLRPPDAIRLEGDDPAGAAGGGLDGGVYRGRRCVGRHGLSLSSPASYLLSCC